MNYCRHLGFFPILIASGFMAWSYAGQSSLTLDHYIKLQAHKVSAYEYPNYREFTRGDIDGDGQEDAAVVYMLEGVRGGIDWLQFLAVSLSSQKGRVIYLRVGGKDICEIDKVRVVKGTIVLTTREYTPHDASCCPSLASTKRLVVHDGRIVVQ